jgi:CHAT domain-containing protein
MSAPFRAAGVAVMLLGACTTPPPEAYVPGGSAAGAASVVAIGNNLQGEPCRMLRSGGGGEVSCGEWDAPSVRVREVPMAPPAQLAEQARTVLAGRLSCEAPLATTVLGGQPAALMNCRRVSGGWPAFALSAQVGGRAWQAEGVLPAVQVAERAIGVLAGVVQPDGPLPPSATLDLLATRLASESFGTADAARFDQLMSVGRDANQAERFATAEAAYRAALGIQERLFGAGHPDTFAPLVRLALQISNQGRFAEAEALFARASPLARRSSDPLAAALFAHYQALHETNRGRTEAALANFTEAETLYRRELPPDQRTGAAATRLPGLEGSGMISDAIGSRALVGTVEVLRNRAALLRAAGRLPEAEVALRAAARLAGSVPSVAGADLVAARLARTGGAAAASAGNVGGAAGSFARSAARFARAVPRSRPYADTLLLRAAAQRDAGTPAPALLPICREAVVVLRELREGTSAAAISPCVDAFVQAGQGGSGTPQSLLAEAFEASQLAQGNVTTTQIARAAARLAEGSRNPAASEAIRQREEAKRRLMALYRDRDEASVAAGRGAGPTLAEIDAQIAAAQAEAADADLAVQAVAPGFAQLVQSVASAQEVMASLRPGEVLTSVFLSPAGPGWTFLLREGDIAVGRIAADEAEVSALVARVRAGVEDGDGSRPFDAEAAHRLHTVLFAALARPLADAERLVVAPSGQLLSLPFGLLVEVPPPAPRGHEGVRFLLDRLPVTHVPAPASLVALRRVGPSQAAQPWFGFGAPNPVPFAQAARTFPSAPECGQLLAALPALPGADLELRVSAQLLGTSPTNSVTGAAFTADAVRRARLRDHRIVHFATHGLLPRELSCVPEAALLASVSPGAPNAADALVTAATVMDLDLDADAVLLSACNSGGGAAAGESLSGLARAFFYAGARSLLVTHWYVDDAAATRVVALALHGLSRGEDLAEALRAAQLDLARNIPEWAHPAFWAGFALVGPGPGHAPVSARVVQGQVRG